MNEREAIARMKNGDIDALKVLVERYQLRAVRTAMMITRDRALAEDVVQATFLRLFQRIHQFDISRPFAPYFMRSVVNAAVQAARKQQRVLSLDAPAYDDVTFEELLIAKQGDPQSALEDRDTREMIRAALDRLTPEQRAAVVMRYYLDMSESDMAEALDAPRGTIKWRLHQARKRLRGLLRGILPGTRVVEVDS